MGRGSVSCYARSGVAKELEPGVFRAANARYRCEAMDREGTTDAFIRCYVPLILTNDLDKRDAEIKLLQGCTADEKKAICAFHIGVSAAADSHRKNVNFRASPMREIRPCRTKMT